MANIEQSWTPPDTLEERLKYALIPPRLYMWRLIRKHLRKGEAELKVLPEIVASDKVAIDVGANKGVYTHLLSRLCLRVEAFEPNPKIYRILTRALPANAAAHAVALSDRGGVADLVVPFYKRGFSNQHASLRPRQRDSRAGVVCVETRTLDSYGFANVGFIKIDVEGGEDAVITGARETIARERPTLLVEIEERHRGQPLAHSLAQIARLGFDVFFLRNGALRPLADLAMAQNRAGTPGYVFNFIFKPKRAP